MDAGGEWWRSYFDDVFYALHEPLFSEEESRSEVASAIEMIGLPAGSRVLDAPCGWGRHTRLLADAGFDAFGADLSLPLLGRAAADAGSYCAADVRFLPFRDASFDAVLNLFTSLGLFTDERDDLRALQEVRRVLRPGGVFLFETMHRDDIVREFVARDRWELPDGTEVRVRRRFDAVTGIAEERWRWTRGEARGRRAHRLRIRSATEIDRLLRSSGLEPEEYYGDWTGESFHHDSPRLIVRARA